MMKKILVSFAVVIVVFMAYVATRPSYFECQRSGVIKASADKIFPYLSQFKLAEQWSPYEKQDPTMQKTMAGVDGQVGATMEFKGGSETGSGKLEILKIVPNEAVDIRLTMLEPIQAEYLEQYTLTSEEGGTKFTWKMSGQAGFISKLMTVFMDIEKITGDQFLEGIANLKAIVESQQTESQK